MLKTALAYLRAGLSVIPIAPDNKKPALNSWQQWQRARARPHAAAIWWRGNNRLAIVCGSVSGNLEMIDFDDNASAFPAWAAQIEKQLLDRLTIENTPRGGKHVAYRCREISIPGNQKIASNADNQTLIETRGEGGYFIASPSQGYILRQGGFAALAEITQHERDSLLAAGYALNQAPPPVERVAHEHGPVSADSPADEFNATHDFRDILEAHGWHYLRTIGENEHYQRPGKPEKETSATVKNNEVLFCFSTNAAPFEAQRGYSLFEAWALLEHGGDMSAAAGAVVKARAPECRYRAVREAETTGAVPAFDADTPDATAAPVSPLASIAAWRAGLSQPAPDDLPQPLNLEWVRDFKPENDARSILGNRFLCEGAQMLLIGQTGIGKSTFAAQWGITVAHAELFFGIKPRGALKSLFIQAENDDGDVAEMIQGTMRGMGRDDWDYLASKLIFIRESAKTGK